MDDSRHDPGGARKRLVSAAGRPCLTAPSPGADPRSAASDLLVVRSRRICGSRIRGVTSRLRRFRYHVVLHCISWLSGLSAVGRFRSFLALYGIGCRISVQLAAPIDHAGKGQSRTSGRLRFDGVVQASPAARTIHHRDASLPVGRTLNMLSRNIFTADIMDNRRDP